MIESATGEVSRLSIEPSGASTRAVCGTGGRSTSGKLGMPTEGRPVGTSPMTGAAGRNSTPIRVPSVSAASGGGRTAASRRGQATTTASAATLMASAGGLSAPASAGQAARVPGGPPSAVARPAKGGVWIGMIMTPIPDMKPETTE